MLKIFSLKELAKNWRVLVQKSASFCKKMDNNIGFLRKMPILWPKIGGNLRKFWR
jgi:hypothetical protein